MDSIRFQPLIQMWTPRIGHGLATINSGIVRKRTDVVTPDFAVALIVDSHHDLPERT
jgi:hypothetical protein